MVINGGRKTFSWNYFYKFIEQLEPKENFRINRLKLMTYKQVAEESSDDFVNRCRRITQRCSLREHEQQQRIIELIIASTSIADFQKELLSKDKTLTLEKTVSIGKIYEAFNIHIKQLRAMVNNNNVYNTNIQAIKRQHVLLCQINVSNVVKAMLFTVKLVQHSDQNAIHVVKQTTGHQYVCQTEQNQNKGQGHKAENTKKKKSYYQSQYRRK